MLFESQLSENLPENKYYLYGDVGGGSTEITIFKKNKVIANDSFNIGTIRMLKDKIDEDELERMKLFIKKQIKKTDKISAVGSGGNINKLFSLSRQNVGTPLNIETVKNYYLELKKMSVEERVHFYKLRTDRADVIVPALKIYLMILKWGGFTEIFVPQVGLVDGVIKRMYLEDAFTSLKGKK